MNRQDARAIIDAMLKRSRLLEDVHFRIPRSVWERYVLARAADRPPKPPTACIRSMGTYRLSVSGDGQVALAAELHLHVFDARSARNLAVLPANFAWSDVRLAVGDEKPAPVELATVNRWLRYTPAGPGRHVISARVELKRLSGRSGTLKLSVPVTVRTQVVFDSPRVFHVTTNSAAMTLTGKKGAGTHGTLSLEPVSRLEIRYGPPVVRRERAARYQISGHVAWNLGAANQQVAADLRVAIIDGRTDRLELLLPAGADRIGITGPDVREARTRAGGATVFLRGTIAGQTRLKVSYEVPSPRGAIRRLARPDVRNGNWTGGTLVVTNTAGGSELMPAAMAGLKEMALADIPAAASAILAGKAVLAYRITSRGWSASLETIDLGEFALRETIVDTAHFTFAYRGHGVVMCAADYEIRNRNRQFLRVTLPRGAKVLLARVSEQSRPLTPLPGRPDTYLLPLERSTASVKGLVSFPVQVVYMYQSQPLAREGTAEAALPQIDVPIAYAWCEAYLPEGAGKLEFAGVMQPVEEYSSKTAVATLGYGQAIALKPPKPRPLTPAPAKLKPGPPVKRAPTSYGSIRYDKTMLGRNYWRAGQEFYKQGKYDEAQKALKNVIQLFPRSSEAANAMRLSSNIDLLRGKLQLRGRAEKAAAAKVQQDFAIANISGLYRQHRLLEEGLRATQKGRKGEAQRKFKAAEAMSKELISRGASMTEQTARLRDVREHLRQSRESVRAGAVTALGQLKKLREAGDIDKASKLARELAQITESLNANADDREADKNWEVRKELEQVVLESAKQLAQKEKVRGLKGELDEVITQRNRLARFTRHRDEQIRDLLAANKRLTERLGKPVSKLIAKVPAIDPSVNEIITRIRSGPVGGAPGVRVRPGKKSGKKLARIATDFERQLAKTTAETDYLDKAARRRDEVVEALQAEQRELTEKLHATVGDRSEDRPSIAARKKELAHRLLAEGSKALDRKDLRMAVGYLNRATQLAPDEPEAKRLLVLARSMTRTGDDGTLILGGLRTVADAEALPARAKPVRGAQPDQAQPVAPGQGAPQGQKITRVYDVRDLVLDLPRDGKDRDKGGAVAGARVPNDEDRKRNTRWLTEQVQSLLAEAGEKNAKVTLFNGQAVVVAREGGQRVAHGLFWGLRDARGAQAQAGTTITLHEAGDKPTEQTDGYYIAAGTIDLSGSLSVDVTGGGQAQPKLSVDFANFIGTNYAWQKRPDLSNMAVWRRAVREGDMPATRPVDGGFVYAYDEKELAARLRYNKGQKVNVSSINVNAGANEAGGLGIHFTTGNNDVRYAVVDEAQFRTLMEVDANRRDDRVVSNERYQGTIVGTDALLANGWVGNVLQSSDADNTFDINGNSIRLSHQKYILIDNGRFLTAVRAGEMQHWTQEAEPVTFVRAPQTIDIPRVGELVKLEKTLVKPEDELVIRFNYQWKGAGK